MREHWPADPINVGYGVGLVYCMACGRLLDSERSGPTKAAGSPCDPVRVSTR